MHPKRRAVLNASIFTGFCAFLLVITAARSFHLPAAPALIICYVLLLVATYFSVRCFDSITPPHDPIQIILDLVLGALYVCIAWSVGDPGLFTLAMTAMFSLSVIKYALILETKHFRVVRRKVFFNALGTVFCLAATVGVRLWDPVLVTSLWTAGFALAHAYLLFVRPLYRLDA